MAGRAQLVLRNAEPVALVEINMDMSPRSTRSSLAQVMGKKRCATTPAYGQSTGQGKTGRLAIIEILPPTKDHLS